MNIRHVETVKKIVGTEKLSVLTDIFCNCEGNPPVLSAARYRADHSQWIDILDELANSQLFLQRDSSGKSYSLRVYALPLVEDRHAERLLVLMNSIFEHFKVLYREYLSDRIALSKITDLSDADPSETQEALFYMSGAHGIWSCLSNDFPYGDDAGICISESVLRWDDFGSVISEFYEWYFVNPRTTANVSQTILSPARRKKFHGFFTSGDTTARPRWYEQLDDTKKALISELDTAMRSGLAALPTMGLRTLIESVMGDYIDDKGSFRENLKEFRKAGYVTGRDADLIEKVIDVGHASTHRAYFPNESDLRVCIDVVKHLMQGIYALKPKMDAVAKSTPKRTREH
jgi:hypothetical protein